MTRNFLNNAYIFLFSTIDFTKKIVFIIITLYLLYFSSSILPTLEIVVKLMVVAQIDEDNNVDFEKLYGQVIKNFPYEALHQNNMSSDKKQKNNTNLEDDTTAKQLNLDICYLGFQMKNQNQEIILQLIDFIGGKLIFKAISNPNIEFIFDT